ncbi:hypothetical protein [Lactobacillus sp. UCMA15818]|uniref:hypothetical protein n=1 Tax=Lactobacillus sp. UCMA15818 TaxID=2583394 RepID=UPI0025B0C9B3|nr:hypothetical protein [Lactobacillus sp. UCMA15818]
MIIGLIKDFKKLKKDNEKFSDEVRKNMEAQHQDYLKLKSDNEKIANDIRKQIERHK